MSMCGRYYLTVCCYHIEDGIQGRCFCLLLSISRCDSHVAGGMATWVDLFQLEF